MRVDLKGVHSSIKRLADGQIRTYWYAWRNGPRITGTPGTPEFFQSYQEAVAARRKPSKCVLRDLLDLYQDSDAFRSLKPKSIKDYRRHITSITREFGDCPFKVLSDPRFRGDALQWRDKIASRSPRQADYVIAVLARVLSWAQDRGHITENVLKKPKRVWKGSRAEKVWTDEDEAKFEAVASPRMLLALKLALWTGQRQGDLLRLAWNAYDGHFIRLQQSKTGVRVSIPVGAPLKAILDATPKVSTAILNTEDERPYTSDGFRASWGKTCKKAGIVGLTFHDLRGTAVTRLAEAGCTEMEIATITGHSLTDVRSTLDKCYFFRNQTISQGAIKKLEKRTKVTNRPTN